jgi:hypothetical protein
MLPPLRAGRRAPAHGRQSSHALSTRRVARKTLRRRQCTALLRGAPHTDCAAQHARAKRPCEPGQVGASNHNRSLDIAASNLAHWHGVAPPAAAFGADNTHKPITRALHWGLTFDMSGRLKRSLRLSARWRG